MVEIIKGLFVGTDDDVAKARDRGFAVCSCCKEGPNGHRSILKYKTHAAPKDKDYYFVQRGKHLALNLIDSDNPNYIPEQCVDTALEFIGKYRAAGDNVLVHCNAGLSRSPTVMLMYLRSIGEMPYNFMQAVKVFHALYPKYDPTMGIKQYARSHWTALAAREGQENAN